MRNAWGRVAVAYDEMFAERMTHLTGRGLDLLAPEPHWDGLDIACGPGLTTAALAERLPAGRTLGIDFAEPMVARAAERLSRPGLEFAVDDAEHLSQPSGAFGAVTCSFGLMYCYDARGALEHMARVLSPGGPAHGARLGPGRQRLVEPGDRTDRKPGRVLRQRLPDDVLLRAARRAGADGRERPASWSSTTRPSPSAWPSRRSRKR